MKIAFGCDHAGTKHREKILEFLKREGHTVTDLGCDCETSCDYPPIAARVSESVARGSVDRGILICGTGVGMSIAANKFKGIRAACC
jgi:ribose 5-phosphate isomerase B